MVPYGKIFGSRYNSSIKRVFMKNLNSIPLISVIIPVYNGEKYVAEAVNSLLNQPCKDLEIVIVNDGSKDNTDVICKKLAEQNANIKYIAKENGGVSSARNLGVKNAVGKYIAFLDSDDIWTTNFYDENLHSKIINDGSDMFSFGYIMSDEKMHNGVLTPATDNNTHKINHCNTFCSYFYSSEKISKFLEFDTTKKFREDILYILRALCMAKNVCCVDKYIFVYRYNSNSAMHTNRDVSVESILDEAVFWKYEILEWLLKQSEYYDDVNIRISKIMMLTYAFEYVRVAATQKYSFETIKKNLNEYISDEELRNPDNLVLNDISKYTQNRYFSDPEQYVAELNKQYFKTKIVSIIRKVVSKNFLARWVYHKKKYRSDITKYVR